MPVKLTARRRIPSRRRSALRSIPKQAATFPLYFRIPAWCSKAHGSPSTAPRSKSTPDAKGFVRIEQTMEQGRRRRIGISRCRSRSNQGYETEYPSYYRQYFDYKPDEVFKKRRLPYESVTYGPLLFALPIADNDPQTPQGERPLAVCLGCKRGRCFRQSENRAKTDAGEMGLAVRCAARDQIAGQNVRLAAYGHRAAACATCGRNRGGNHPFDPLRLHEVPNFHVPRDAKSLAGKTRELGNSLETIFA